jgi:hypothetical protein
LAGRTTPADGGAQLGGVALGAGDAVVDGVADEILTAEGREAAGEVEVVSRGERGRC